ncbi:MAG: LPS export ABC transporter periplasmic protein LptC [Ignavibacteria bacterium]|jgi:LPS export ABC transporter protein LptC|nr:LPS export ABC transporter periplasmic protein LptC [Ignavibacteria bacterium]
MRSGKTLFLFFFLAMVTSFISCEDKFKPVQTSESTDDLPSQESWNSTVTFSDSGKVKAVLKAGHILVYSKKGFTLIDSGAVVDFYKDGEIASTLSGNRGKINDKTKDIEMYDSVQVVSKDGSELKTQKLLWTNLTQRVSSDVFVSIKTPTETIEGIGFESDQNLKNYKIYKVSGTF